jgi:hypothetical protein
MVEFHIVAVTQLQAGMTEQDVQSALQEMRRGSYFGWLMPLVIPCALP